jgi:hypothetical protein
MTDGHAARGAAAAVKRPAVASRRRSRAVADPILQDVLSQYGD